MYNDAETRPNDASHANLHDYSLNARTTVKEGHFLSATSISGKFVLCQVAWEFSSFCPSCKCPASCFPGHMQSAKKTEYSEQKRTISMEAISSNLTVKDYSFFFDPDEPTGIVSKGTVIFLIV